MGLVTNHGGLQTEKKINRDRAPRRRAGSLAGEKPVCEGLTNQQ